MYICICSKVTDHQIRQAVLDGNVNTMRELRVRLGVCDQCGKCAAAAQTLLRDTLAERHLVENQALTASC